MSKHKRKRSLIPKKQLIEAHKNGASLTSLSLESGLTVADVKKILGGAEK